MSTDKGHPRVDTGTEGLALGGALVLAACEVAAQVGWLSADVATIVPSWIRIALPCLLLLPMKPRSATYWLESVPWAVAIALLLHDSVLPHNLWIVRVILWSYLAVRAGMVLWSGRVLKLNGEAKPGI